MSKFIKQCKGLDVNKLKLNDNDLFHCGIKYDGVYVQIHKIEDSVHFFKEE